MYTWSMQIQKVEGTHVLLKMLMYGTVCKLCVLFVKAYKVLTLGT